MASKRASAYRVTVRGTRQSVKYKFAPKRKARDNTADKQLERAEHADGFGFDANTVLTVRELAVRFGGRSDAGSTELTYSACTSTRTELPLRGAAKRAKTQSTRPDKVRGMFAGDRRGKRH